MKNSILNGTSNHKNRYRYTFERNDKFKKEFTDLLLKLGFKEERISEFWTRTIRLEEDNNTYEEDEYQIHPRIAYFEDSFFFLENKNYEIELFIGKRKIFIVIRTKNKKKETRENLVNQLLGTKWISQEEAKKRMKEKQKQLEKYIPKSKKILIQK